jgi:leucyl/phenylalanyl-tRNA--protein transferase
MVSFKSRDVAIIEPGLLLAAYRAGYFPMASSRTGPIRWFSPDPRAIIPLDRFKISRSLRQVLRKGIFEIRINTAFESVIRNCASRDDTWISEEIIQSYLNLHRLGYAHSVEAWSEGLLAGGLYGVALGGAFFGESMYSRKRNASKVALVHLVQRLRERGFELLDTQYITPHLAQFGTIEVSKEDYLARLKHAVEKQVSFSEETFLQRGKGM